MPFVKGQPRPPRKTDKPVTADKTEGETMEAVQPVIRTAPKKKRVPVGLRNPMSVDQDSLDPNFEYRFVRGKNDRMKQFLDGGYEVVQGNQAGDANIAVASSMGSATDIPSGDSDERLFLMRIPKEYYLEDQEAKQRKVNAIEKQLHDKPRSEGLEGKFEIN